MTDPMAIQHGGNHYKGMKIEPFEMSLANLYDGAIHSIVKYVSRHAVKNGAEDLAKAHHITDIRRVQIARYGTIPSRQTIPMGRYIAENKIDGPEATALSLVHEWSSEVHGQMDASYPEMIRRTLAQLISIRYPDFDLATLKG